jgi:hypothetical protein
VPPGTKLFGGKELHEDGVPHYHVVMRFPHRVHWTDARKQLMIITDQGTVDTKSICIEVPQRGESVDEFLQRCQAYCSKDNNFLLFGDWIPAQSLSCSHCRQPVQSSTEVVCVQCADEDCQSKVC